MMHFGFFAFCAFCTFYNKCKLHVFSRYMFLCLGDSAYPTDIDYFKRVFRLSGGGG